MERESRNINIELLRVIAMLLIIVRHFIEYTYLLEKIPKDSITYYSVSMLHVITCVAVNVYVLISGYFLCEKKIKIKKVVVLWIQVFLYSLVFYISLVILKMAPFSIADLMKVIMPISGNQYWFARVYIGMYLLMPFLNLFIKCLNKKQHQFLLVVSLLMFSLWRSFIPFAVTLNSAGGNSIIWFVVLYVFAAYVKFYGTPIKMRKVNCLCTIGLLVFAFLSKEIISVLSDSLGFEGKGASLFTEYTSFPMLFAALLLLIIFAQGEEFVMSKRSRRLVFGLSSSTFGVYLIHDNIYLKKVLWDVINRFGFMEKKYVVFYILAISVLIFGVATFVDKILSVLVKKIAKRVTIEGVQRKIEEYLYDE